MVRNLGPERGAKIQRWQERVVYTYIVILTCEWCFSLRHTVKKRKFRKREGRGGGLLLVEAFFFLNCGLLCSDWGYYSLWRRLEGGREGGNE